MVGPRALARVAAARAVNDQPVDLVVVVVAPAGHGQKDRPAAVPADHAVKVATLVRPNRLHLQDHDRALTAFLAHRCVRNRVAGLEWVAVAQDVADLADGVLVAEKVARLVMPLPLLIGLPTQRQPRHASPSPLRGQLL